MAFSGAYASIVTLGNDIGQAIIDDDFDLDIRISPQERDQLWPEDRIGRIVGGCNPNRAGGLLPQFTEALELGLDLLKPWAYGMEQAFTGLGWGDAAGGTGRQLRIRALGATGLVAGAASASSPLGCMP